MGWAAMIPLRATALKPASRNPAHGPPPQAAHGPPPQAERGPGHPGCARGGWDARARHRPGHRVSQRGTDPRGWSAAWCAS